AGVRVGRAVRSAGARPRVLGGCLFAGAEGRTGRRVLADPRLAVGGLSAGEGLPGTGTRRPRTSPSRTARGADQARVRLPARRVGRTTADLRGAAAAGTSGAARVDSGGPRHPGPSGAGR